MSWNKETGPSLHRRKPSMDPREVQSQIDAAASMVEERFKEIEKRLESIASGEGLAGQEAGKEVGAPSLVVDGDLYNPGNPIGPNHWLRENYLAIADGASAEAEPRITIRATLAPQSPAGTLYLGLLIKHTDAETNPPTETSRTMLLTESVSANNASDGVVDISLTGKGIEPGDVVSCLLVGYGTENTYAETVYGETERRFTAGSDPPIPETPTITRIHRGQHHVKVKVVIQGSYDLEEPYNAPGSINYYSKLEVWAREEDDDGVPSSGIHPDDGDAVGWYHAKDIGIKGLIKKIRAETKAGGVVHKGLWFGVKRHKGRKLWLAFRFWDSLGRQGGWANITPTTSDPGGEGQDSDQAPGWAIVSGDYAPGGAVNYFSTSATDPADSNPDAVAYSWTAPEDITGTKGVEASARVRVYLTNSENGTTPEANPSNVRLTYTLRDATQKGKIYHGTAHIESGKTFVDLSFRRAFKVGRAIEIRKLVVEGNGFRNVKDLSSTPIVFYAGTASLPNEPSAPSLLAQNRHRTNTVLKVGWSAHSQKDTYRVLEVYSKAHAAETHPDDAGANGWTLEKAKDIKAVRNIGHARVIVGHGANEDLDYCFRIVDCYGRSATLDNANWLYVTPSTAPESDDVAPTVGAVTATSWEDDIPGTPAKECDLEVTVPWSGAANWVKVKVQATINGATKYLHKRVDFATATNGSQAVLFRRKFKRGVSVTITAIAGMGTAKSAESSPINHTMGGSAIPTPAAPSILSVTQNKRAAIVTVQVTDASSGVLQIFAATSGTTGNPDTNPSGWKKVWHGDVTDDVAAGRNTEAHVGRAGAALKWFYARVRSRYDASVFSAWSNEWTSGTVPDSDDTAPTIGTISATTWEDDIAGTKAKECDVEVTVPWTGEANWVKASIQATINGATKTLNKRADFPKASNGSQAVLFRRKFKRGTALTITAIAGMGTAQSATSNTVNLTAGDGALPSNPAFTGLVVITRKRHHTDFQAQWSTSANSFREIEVEITYDGGTTWEPLKVVNIYNRRTQGKARIRVQHVADFESPCIRLMMRDIYGQESNYYPSDSGTNAAWWGSTDPGGDNEEPITKWPWTFSGPFAFYDAANKRIEISLGAYAKLDVPLHKQRVAMHGDWSFSGFTTVHKFGFLDDAQRNGYYVSVDDASHVSLYKVNAAGSATLVGTQQTLSSALVAYQAVDFRFEVHKTKVVLIIGSSSQRFEWADATYRTKGWKPWFISGGAAKTYIEALYVNNGGEFYNGLATANVMAVFDSSGYISGGSLQFTVSGATRNLGTMVSKVGNGIYLDGAYIRERAPVTTATMPTTDLRAGMLQPFYESGGTGAGKYRLGVMIPANYFGAGIPSSDIWAHFNADNTISAAAPGSSVPGGGGEGGTCFREDVLVLTPSGAKAIGNLQVGDIILSLNGAGALVEDYILTVKEHEVGGVMLLNGELAVTEEHMLFVWDNGRPPKDCPMISAGEALLGVLLYGLSGSPLAGLPIVLREKDFIQGTCRVLSLATTTKKYLVGGPEKWYLVHNLKVLDP